MITKETANKYIRAPKGIISKIKDRYYTTDIIKQILAADRTAFRDVEEFAKHIRYNNMRDLAKQLFDFLYTNIKYVEDAEGSQLVKMPSALWAEKQGDCKSITLFICAVLKAKGIPYTYRFASYSSNGIFTHVYPIAHGQNYDVIIDVVYKKFNQEKEYTTKKDYTMKGLYQVSGTEEKPAGVLDIFKPVDEMTPEEMELAIVKQRLEIEKAIVDKKKGVGSAKADQYQKAIDGVGAFIGAVVSGDEAKQDAIINAATGRAKTFLTKAKTAVKTAAKKTGTAVKKVAVTAAKVVTAPARLLIKGILEIYLPQAAPAFLYLFITDEKVVANLPAKAKRKREKQIKLANFIVNGIGMQRSHFMGILRNGIMKRYSMSPEAKIALMMKKKNNISGIGSVAVVTVVIQAIQKIVEWIKQNKKSKENVEALTADDMPDDSDFDGINDTERSNLAKQTQAQKNAIEPGKSLDNETALPDNGGGRVKNICGF